MDLPGDIKTKKSVCDVDLARKYISKHKNAVRRGVPWNLSFTSFKNLHKAKRCQYTGKTLTEPKMNPKAGEPARPTDRSIDRIDCSKGYEAGNVVACCYAANNLKAMWEDSSRGINYQETVKMINKLEKMGE